MQRLSSLSGSPSRRPWRPYVLPCVLTASPRALLVSLPWPHTTPRTQTLRAAQVRRHESCKVVLLGQSEFEAHDVTLTGSHTFVVPDGHRLSVTAAPDGAGIEAKLTPLTPLSAVDGAAATLLGGAAGGFQPSWEWQYVMDSNGAVKLSYVGTTTTVGSRSAPAVGLTAPVMAAAERQGRQVLDFSI